MSLVVIAFLVSIAAGGFGALVGIGGGLIIVPVLTVLLGVPIKTAIAASLIGVIATSMSASAHYLDSGIADRRLGLLLLLATAAGGITGGLLGSVIDGRVLALLFGTLLVFVAVQMIRQRAALPAPVPHDDPEGGFVSSYIEPSDGSEVSYRARRLQAGAAVSFAAGNVSGLLGVGGGVINVPTMNLAMGVPIRVATTTSTFMLGPTAAASALLYFSAGVLDPVLAGPVALGVFIGARIGARMSSRVSQGALRVAFIAVALIFAMQMFFRAITG
ncbi:MAG: sulfite exporter TauE/SafE family protein [Chloroflexi bacterium]|nr:sulfite exporter TauE/SafE family protein [Chloroflexota bacterium]